MSLDEFIFSTKRSHRLARHLSFWLCWALFMVSAQIAGLHLDIGIDLLEFQVIRTVDRLVPLLIFCYFTVYYLVPRFIPKRKYKHFVASFLLFVCVCYMINYGWFFLMLEVIQIHGNGWSTFSRIYNSFYTNINFTGALPACCLMLGIKYFKDWYYKQRQSEQLQQENLQAELQLLKAQIHPHFLFNTLNNIYSFTLTQSPLAADLIDKLSGMMDYVYSEGKKEWVSLEKELHLLQDYIGLEKVRYGDRLEIQVQIMGEPKDKMIAPFLMIPFVENCFKHGASMMRGRQWIRLFINIEDDVLDFTLSNSKPSRPIQKNGKSGIGLANVQKRLQLLFPGKHMLKIESLEDAYSVHLQVELQKMTLPTTKTSIQEPQTVFYA